MPMTIQRIREIVHIWRTSGEANPALNSRDLERGLSLLQQRIRDCGGASFEVARICHRCYRRLSDLNIHPDSSEGSCTAYAWKLSGREYL